MGNTTSTTPKTSGAMSQDQVDKLTKQELACKRAKPETETLTFMGMPKNVRDQILLKALEEKEEDGGVGKNGAAGDTTPSLLLLNKQLRDEVKALIEMKKKVQCGTVQDPEMERLARLVEKALIMHLLKESDEKDA